MTVLLYLFSGIFYPLSTPSAPTRWIGQVNPRTYGAHLLRCALLGVNEIGIAASGAMLALFSVAAAVIAIAAFDRGTQR